MIKDKTFQKVLNQNEHINKNKQMEQKIHASFILEILGRPSEHIIESMKGIIKKLDEEKGIKIIESKIHPPKKIEDANQKEKNEDLALYTTFAEIEAEIDDINSLLILAFNYMPSNIEIISPENFLIKNGDISGILTNTILRLHRYDEIAKRLTIDKKILEDKLKEIMKDK